tara:strand:+ start:9303 stop:10088 length:786 start_codon:yes stop_codon:yes gene_type:complete
MFFGVNSNQFLKFVYNALLTGMPSLMNNPINKNILNAPFSVNEFSTYINYKLDSQQLNAINEFLIEKDNGMNLAPSSILNEESKDYYLSINIYNCTSPLFDFISNDPVTRCELNIYVKDSLNNKGTLIMDYESNILSLDPENIFKKAGKVKFNKDYEYLNGNVKNNQFNLDFNYNWILNTINLNKLSTNLIKYTDRIYYPNGYYDKLFYDSTLIHNNIIEVTDYNVYFKFLNIEFTDINSVFYFENKIDFVGGLWANLYDL